VAESIACSDHWLSSLGHRQRAPTLAPHTTVTAFKEHQAQQYLVESDDHIVWAFLTASPHSDAHDVRPAVEGKATKAVGELDDRTQLTVA
jgi:hypothetical protein